jgi:hypothetical protein
MLRGKAIGLAGLRREQEARQAIDHIASSFRKELYESLQRQLDTFRENLELFARKYRKKIENEPVGVYRKLPVLLVTRVVIGVSSTVPSVVCFGRCRPFGFQEGFLGGNSWNWRLLL